VLRPILADSLSATKARQLTEILVFSASINIGPNPGPNSRLLIPPPNAHGDGMANLSADIGEISWQDARPAGALGSLVLVIDVLQGARTHQCRGR
jgi:hypothetical protein